MKKELTYKAAFAQLEILVDQLEEGSIDLEQLATKIKQANEMIEICTKKLRAIEDETGAAAAIKIKPGKK
jgi:exodeoxyribonuclease VII small subunit